MVNIFSFIFRYTPVQVSCTAQFPMTAKKRWKNFSDCSNLRNETSPLIFPPNDAWGASAEIPHWWRVTTLFWKVLLIDCFLCRERNLPQPFRSTTKTWVQWQVISVELVLLFLWHHFEGKPTEWGGVGWGGVGCRREKDARFLRLRSQGINENNSPTIMAIVYIYKKSREQQHLISTRRY